MSLYSDNSVAESGVWFPRGGRERSLALEIVHPALNSSSG